MVEACPLYPRKRTVDVVIGMSAKGHKRSDRLRGPLTKHFSLRQELCRIPSIFQALLSSALWLVCQ